MEILQKARRLVSKIYMCSVWCLKKKITKLCSRMTFRARVHRTGNKILEDNLEHFRCFWETLLESEWTKKPQNIFGTDKFQVYFWETNISLFLGSSAFRLGSIWFHCAIWQLQQLTSTKRNSPGLFKITNLYLIKISQRLLSIKVADLNCAQNVKVWFVLWRFEQLTLVATVGVY